MKTLTVVPRRWRVAPAVAFVLLTVTTALAGCVDPETSRPPMPDSAIDRTPHDFFLGGIQVNEADPEAWFDALETQSMNTIQVTEYAQQGNWDTDDLEGLEIEPRILDEIRGAGRRGLSVVYVCRVHLDSDSPRNEFLWHGMIMPASEELVTSWFARFRRFVVERAEMAEREGVDVFMIGSELNALATTVPATRPPELEEYFLNQGKQAERRRQLLADAADNREAAERQGYDSVASYIDARIARERDWATATTGGDAHDLETINRRRERLKGHWQALIEEVRRVYSGPVGYAANFDHYHQVGFWSSLDVIGINAYFKLRHRLLADESEQHLYPLLVDGWRDALADLAKLRDEGSLDDKPVIFTEMGYTFRARSTVHPWADEGFALIPGPSGAGELIVWRDQPERFEERAWAVRALWQAHSELDSPLLAGILYWKLSSHDYHFGDESFVVHIGPGSDDPILPELRRFVER